MAHHKSCLKRIRQTRKRKYYNKVNKKSMKLAMRAVREATEFVDASTKLIKAGSILDRVTAKGIVHKNFAANKKSKLAKFVNSLKTA